MNKPENTVTITRTNPTLLYKQNFSECHVEHDNHRTVQSLPTKQPSTERKRESQFTTYVPAVSLEVKENCLTYFLSSFYLCGLLYKRGAYVSESFMHLFLYTLFALHSGML